MAFSPDLPFPKSAGDQIRSKDWNDLIAETRRLDTAKVERTGDAITGPLSVAGALAIGKASAAATAKLDVAGDLRINDSNLLLRGGADQSHGLGWFGAGKLFAGTNVDGPVLYGNSGGGLGTNASGAQKIALSWDTNGNIAIGVPSAGFKVDVGNRIRLRQSAGDTAGMWLFQTAPNGDRAFVGMADDNTVGFWGNAGVGWGLRMNVSTGDLQCAGEINSNKFKATTLMSSRQGPLPLSTTFTSAGGTLLLFSSGSGFRNGVGGVLGMMVSIDNLVMATVNGFTNEIGSHKTFPTSFVVVTSIGAGTHTLTINARDVATLTDGNDFFNVMVLELPFRNTGFLGIPIGTVTPVVNPGAVIVNP